MTRIAALIVGYRSSSEIAPMVATLRSGLKNEELSVTVHVIDNSGDPEEIIALSNIPGIDRILPNDRNLGYGGGMNALASTLDSKVDWLLVCNPDIRFLPGSIESLVDAGARYPNAALIGPLMRDVGGTTYPSARAFPSIRTGVGHVMFANTWPSNPWTARYHRGGSSAEPVEDTVDWLSGACLLVRTEPFAQVDGFDEGYFMYFEDVDLAWRLNKAGYGAVYAPSSSIVHSGAHATSAHAEMMRDAHHRSASRFLGKRYAVWWLSPLKWTMQFGLYLRREFGRRRTITPPQ
ncbi:MAG: glycosyltransferase family 2 protein [Cryobacterium sp.]|nr:glycosyltransferase family 2 protein [Cryobacterium sp.]